MFGDKEHRGWMDKKKQDGWVFGRPRCNQKKHHPCMVPYSELPETEKDKDRNAIRKYVEIVRKAGFKIRRRPWFDPE